MDAPNYAIAQSADVRAHVFVPVAEHRHQSLVLEEVAKCVLHHVAREVHRALCRIPALVHDDRDKVASARMLRVRRDILRGRVSKRRAHIYGNAPLPRQ